jgi:alpha 1,2-mannosyltransferase
MNGALIISLSNRFSSSSVILFWLRTITIGALNLESSSSVILVSTPPYFAWALLHLISVLLLLGYDPFLVMQDEKKVYGFTISLFEYIETIPTLWEATKGTPLPSMCLSRRRRLNPFFADFIKANPQYIPEDNAMDFISDDGGETYNRCHFWSNFEIGDLNFWRSEAYMKYFEHLDNAGGFYYERWVSSGSDCRLFGL